jgi:hypothetical protein
MTSDRDVNGGPSIEIVPKIAFGSDLDDHHRRVPRTDSVEAPGSLVAIPRVSDEPGGGVGRLVGGRTAETIGRGRDGVEHSSQQPSPQTDLAGLGSRRIGDQDGDGISRNAA